MKLPPFAIGDFVEHTNSHRRGRVRSIRPFRDGAFEMQIDIDFDDIWWNSRHVKLVNDLEISRSTKTQTGSNQ